ncbi:MAG: CDP-paratose 2-epimerase, partial [Deltaproteobacteria bacterium]|nr:CDP-paratose 2-epimerase [Deltaproteobacteria bacterium]
RWQSEIAVWDPPLRFVDRQTRGPYRLWVHEHKFISKQGGTIVEDSVQYAALGGGIVQRLLVAPDLRRIFSHRHKVLQEIFAGKLAQSAV